MGGLQSLTGLHRTSTVHASIDFYYVDKYIEDVCGQSNTHTHTWDFILGPQSVSGPPGVSGEGHTQAHAHTHTSTGFDWQLCI